MRHKKPRAKPARCEPLDRRLLLSASPTTYGIYPLAPGAGLTAVGNVSPATSNGSVFFTAENADGRSELWRTDGTADGTVVVGPLPAGYTAAAFSAEVVFAGDQLFAAQTAVPGFLVDGESGATTTVGGPTISGAVAVGDDVFFAGTSDGQPGLYRTDGTATGTVRLLAAQPLDLTAADGRLYFFTSDAAGLHLWTATATSTTATELATTNPNPTPGSPLAGQTAVDGSRLFFVAPAGPTGTVAAVWTSDGTAGGTRLLNGTDLTYAPSAQLFAVSGRPVYDGPQFRAVDPTTGVTIQLLPNTLQFPLPSGATFEVNGVAQTSVTITLPGTVATAAVAANGRLMFAPDFGTGLPSAVGVIAGSGLAARPGRWWVTDGTTAGTGPVVPAGSPAPTVGDGSYAILGQIGPRFATAVAFAGGLALAPQLPNAADATSHDASELFYADDSAGTDHRLANVYDPTDLSVAAAGLVFVADTAGDDADPQLWAVGTAGVAAATSTLDTTPPTATFAADPADATDGTFTVRYTDPSGVAPIVGNRAIDLDLHQAVSGGFTISESGGTLQLGGGGIPAYDPLVDAGIGVADTVTPVDPDNPVQLLSAVTSDAGRTITATYHYPVAVGVTYDVMVADGTVYDTAGNDMTTVAIGTLAGPAVAAPVPTPTPTPTPSPTPTPTPPPTPIDGASADTTGSGITLSSSADLVAGTTGTALVTVSAARAKGLTRHVRLFLAAAGDPPQAGDPVVATASVPNRAASARRPLTVRVRFTLPAGMAAGSYQLAAVLDGSVEATDVYFTGPAVTVSAATVDAAVTVAGKQAPLRAGNRGVVRVRVTNQGNTAAHGDVCVAVGDATTLFGSATRSVNLRPGSSIVVPVTIVVPADLTDADAVTATLTTDAAWDDAVMDDKTISLATAFG